MIPTTALKLVYFPGNQAFSRGWGVFHPFSDPGHYVLGILTSAVLIVVFTSIIYFVFHRYFLDLQEENEADDSSVSNGETDDDWEDEDAPGSGKDSRLQLFLVLFAAVVGVVSYLLAQGAFHSVRVDPLNQWIALFRNNDGFMVPLADSLLALGIMGLVWGWIRFFQVLLIDDIFARYARLVAAIPLYSASLILTFAMSCWYFYSNVFPLWWYLFSFGLIYGMIYFFSLKDFKRRIRMHLTRTVEFEEHFSLKTISIVAGVVLTLCIGVPHAIYGSLSTGYVLALFLGLWIVSMYMTPGRVFRHVKVFPRYASASARMLNFARYTRKYLFVWFIILTVFSFILGAGVIFDPGFTNPRKNLKKTVSSLKGIGSTMHQYMDQNKNYLPSKVRWQDGTWIDKVKNPKIKKIPPCPFDQRWVYLKWRNKDHRAVFEVRVTGGAHKRAGVENGYPCYNRFKGLVVNRQQDRAKSAQKKLGNSDNNK